jgi:uroporphyrinogen-III decarboxylase
MNREYYIELAKSGLCMPIGTDLVLREKDDEAEILLDGNRLGQVLVEAAKRFRAPLAIHLMDLKVEKEFLLSRMGVPAAEIDSHHFAACPSDEALNKTRAALQGPLSPRMQANCDAIRYVAASSDLMPTGSCIGPFSLMTKLVSDPITGIYLSGSGVRPEEDDEVKLVEAALDLAWQVVKRSIQAQIEAGAQLVMVCEPAANAVFISPNQLEAGSDVFERLVMQPNRRIKELLDANGVDLMFHDCGELTDGMVSQLASLCPAILSLGSSRVLWEDADLVPKDVVLYGNLPTKRFYSEEMTVEKVERMARELTSKMEATGHPFILGSECDVLSVPGAQTAIKSKVVALMDCGCCAAGR